MAGNEISLKDSRPGFSLQSPFGVIDDLLKGQAFASAMGRMKLDEYINDKVSAYNIFERQVLKQGNKPMYIFEDQVWTWNHVEKNARRIAHFLKSEKFNPKDSIAMIVPNKPSFVEIWLGCLSIGVVPAFINYNLSGDALAHCITVSEADTILVDTDMVQHVNEIRHQLKGIKAIYEWRDGLSKTKPNTRKKDESKEETKDKGKGKEVEVKQNGHSEENSAERLAESDDKDEEGEADVEDSHQQEGLSHKQKRKLKQKKKQEANGSVEDSVKPVEFKIIDKDLLSKQSTESLGNKDRSGLKWKDPACLIYTSGSTGFPKAAPCSHGKVTTASMLWSKFNAFTPKDRIFTVLPLYHSSGAFLCVAAAWSSGSSVILERKFSATKFWHDVRSYNATIVQYIGEICRYLLAQPPSALDKEHKVRMAYGNGMRADVWEKFRQRFGVKVISEFFASTEGNTFLFNYNVGKFGAGAVGRESFLSRLAVGDMLLKIDQDTQEIWRDDKGNCKQAGYNEPGELVSRIDSFVPAKDFGGYKGNKGASDEKIIKDVLWRGDAYFRTGDLLRRDRYGFYYFEDRLGDTFRWKSENVSTEEVTSVMNSFKDGLNWNVYGVLVPNQDGRAGCAAIHKDKFNGLDLEKVAKHAMSKLPKYACPQFIRVTEKSETTSTMKNIKTGLRKEGVDPNEVIDKVYWLRGEKYVEFSKEDWDGLTNGDVRM